MLDVRGAGGAGGEAIDPVLYFWDERMAASGTLRARWLTEGVVIKDEPHFLAGWEVMTNWQRNDAHGRFNLPSADFAILDKQGRLVVLELKMRVRSPGDCWGTLSGDEHGYPAGRVVYSRQTCEAFG